MRPFHIASICLGTLAITSWVSSGCINATNCYDFGDCAPGDSSADGGDGDGGSSDGGNNAGGMSTTASSGSSDGNGGMSTTASSGGGEQTCPTGYECVPEGTTADFVRLPDSGSCSGSWSVEIPYAPPNDPGCDACTCGPPTGGLCTISLNSFSGASCKGTVAPTTATASTCFPLSDTFNSLTADPPVAQSGNCMPEGGGPAQLSTTMACGTAETPDLSCGPGMVCVPDGSGALCNVVSAEQSCAAGYQGVPGTVAAVQDDTRLCSCNCDNPPNPTCINSFAKVYSDDSCMTFQKEISLDGKCSGVSDSSDSVSLYPGAWQADPCTPTATSSGSVTFGPEERLCCMAGN